MFEKIGALINLFRKGEEVDNPTVWKQGGISIAALAAFLVALDAVLRAFGVDVPITADQAKNIAGGIIAFVGVVLPAITSERAGLLPPKQKQPDSPSDSGVPSVDETKDPS